MWSQIRVQVLTRGFVSSIPTFVVFMPNWGELAVAGSDYDVLVCAKSKVSDRRHLSELRIPGFGCRTPLLVPRVWLFMLGKDSASSGTASWSVLAMNPVCFVFSVGYTTFMFMPFTITQGMMVHFMIVSLTLWLGYSQLMKRSLYLLVMRILITQSGWSRSLLY